MAAWALAGGAGYENCVCVGGAEPGGGGELCCPAWKGARQHHGSAEHEHSHLELTVTYLQGQGRRLQGVLKR